MPEEAAREFRRRLPIGAEPLPGEGVSFRVWALGCSKVAVVLEGSRPGEESEHELQAEEGGYFSGVVSHAGVGTRYRFRLNDGSTYPDPASRYQPEGPHGPSEVVDPARFAWSDQGWNGPDRDGQVMYELHVGTFTVEGTWAAATQRLEHLSELGITVIEMMPVADFAGEFGWGYDGVDLFAPTRLYGTPDDLRAFVDRAHALGIAVILDVVYNHLGPAGNYLSAYTRSYFSDRYENEWGEPINFDGPDSGPVREFFIANAGYWIDEFHMDGLRLDATQQIFDASPQHVLSEITQRVRDAAGRRSTLVIAENEPQEVVNLLPREQGGYGMDGLWNDDFHHAAQVALTGRNEAYFSDYYGSPQELLSAAKWGFLFQGQRYRWQKERRGTAALNVHPRSFVNYIQNHDQVANTVTGARCHLKAAPGVHRALTAFLLLAPGTPMLFQGQEFSATSPFLYFADHEPDLAAAVRAGRLDFLGQFPSVSSRGVAGMVQDPGDVATFTRCKLDHGERETNATAYALHHDLIAMRKKDPVFRAPVPRGVDGAVLSDGAFVLRYFAADGMDRLLLVNLGRDLQLDPAPEPLLAPPANMYWVTHWSSEDPAYGGSGAQEAEGEDGWHIPGHAALVLIPKQSRPGFNGWMQSPSAAEARI